MSMDSVYGEEGAAGDTIEEVIENISAQYGVTGEVEPYAGVPWPVVRWSGDRVTLEKLAREYYKVTSDREYVIIVD